MQRHWLERIIRKFGWAAVNLEAICQRCEQRFGKHEGLRCPRLERDERPRT